ncbi:PREDICTED: uncharacterized protein LOC104597563 [Nelumbo nucifera]|uniref:WRC domain-containing protein n=2 Tax=Nelumbo nucifera TaxID=4432 RepID=A0A822ZEM7_NELNU|nr:PREDICTED: uncharacterized protein LOC104597563 [Nelumbo nucifera]DAD42191.1 TPA_asm: hypothetical protein HUJ06_000421 [Nelumbo nucifera]
MRIRKRSQPLPFSSLCPVTLLDPQPSTPASLEHNQVGSDAQVKEEEEKATGLQPGRDLVVQEQNTYLNRPCRSPDQCPQLPSKVEEHQPCPDLLLTIVRGGNGWFFCDGKEGQDQKIERDFCMMQSSDSPTQVDEELIGGDERERKNWRVKTNNLRKESSLGAEAADGISVSSSCYDQVGRWGEGEKAIPLKKRRGSFDRRATYETTTLGNEKKMKSKLKTKTNKRLAQQAKEEEEDKEEQKREPEGKEGSSTENSNNARRSGSERVVMEGSRCSRVNGRGWRCCQQTLVGYSLCEHHLGKGRLRSMSSVRSRTSAVARPKKDSTAAAAAAGDRSMRSLSSEKKHDEQTLLHEGQDDDDDEEKPLMITKKRKKIGIVKARSISSLLGLTENTVATRSDNSHGRL